MLATFKSDTVGVTVPLSTMSKKCDSGGASQLVDSIAAGSTKLLAFNPSTHSLLELFDHQNGEIVCDAANDSNAFGKC